MFTRSGGFGLASTIAAVSCVVLSVSGANAAPITFTGTDGGTRSASVAFDVSGTNLLVTLTNTSTSDVLNPTQVLTAVFFNTPGMTLTPVSATLHSGSTVLFGTTDAGGVVGGEWAYAAGLSSPISGDGISSSGLGLFGVSDLFPGTNLEGPADPDGLQYGITSAGDSPLTGNAPVTGGNALIQNSVDFVLSGWTAGADPLDLISLVVFQYGTALTDTELFVTGSSHDTPTPEPASLALVGFGLMAVGVLRRRARRG